MNTKACGLLTALVVLLAGANVQASPIAVLTLVSQPGDTIGHGHSYEIAYIGSLGADVFAEVKRNVNGWPAEIEFILDQGISEPAAPNTDADLTFGTNALGIPLQPGIYTNIERAGLASDGHPGLSVVFSNNACNTDTGRLGVTDATFGVDAFFDPVIVSFSATFEQHCEGAAPALFGTFTYNANAPTEVPEPAGYWLVAVGVTGLLGGVAIGKLRKDYRS